MRKKLKISMVIISILFVLGGCTKGVSTKGEVVDEITEINQEKLSKYAGTEVGNNSNISGIVNNLPGNIYVESLELHTDREPLGVTVNYGKNNIKDEKINEFLKEYKDIAYENGRELFILIPNLVVLNLDFTSMGGEKIIFNRSDFIGGKCGNN